MKSDTFAFEAADGVQIFVYRGCRMMLPVKGAVQLHTVAEHAMRYERFAGALTNPDMLYAQTITADTAKPPDHGEAGYFADENAGKGR